MRIKFVKPLILALLALSLPALAATHYVDYSTGSDSNNGTSESTPWKHAPGMAGLTPAGKSTGDGCSANCASYTPAAGDFIILRGGVVWPYTTAPWNWSWGGSGSSSTYGCTGSGCIYVGNAVGAGLPAWNTGTVVSISLKRDLGGWNPSSPPSVSCSGGGGTGAAATAYVVPSANIDPNIAGMLYNVKLTSGGSGYTSAPTCTVSGGGGTATLATDINRAVFDLGATQSSPPDWPVGQYGSYPNTYSPGLNISASYVIASGIEVRNLEGQYNANGGLNDLQIAMIEMSNPSITVSNAFVHGMFEDCMVAGSCTANTGEFEYWFIGPQGAHDEVANSITENGDAALLGTSTTQASGICQAGEMCTVYAAGVGTGTQAGYGPVSVHGVTSYANSWQFRLAGSDTSGSDPYLLYGNEAWLTLFQRNFSAHINSRYMQLSVSGDTLFGWNNIFHNQVGGTSSQLQCAPGEAYTFYNEAQWGIGTGTQPYSLYMTGGGCTLNLYNDTMYANNGGYCVNTQADSSTTTVTMQNDHCISTTLQNPFWQTGVSDSTYQDYAGSTTQANIQAASVVESISTANGEGYTVSDVLAPTASSNDTVTFASGAGTANLTSLCTGYLSALCSDINGNARPATGGWQAGAYQYAAAPAGATAPPVVSVTSITP